MTAAELAQLLLAMPPDAAVTVAAHKHPCEACGSTGEVLAVALDQYDWYTGPGEPEIKPEVTLQYGTDQLDDTRKATP